MEEYVDDVIAILDEISRSLRAIAVLHMARWISDSPDVLKEHGGQIAESVGNAMRPVLADVEQHAKEGE